MRSISSKRQREMVRDVFNARHDVVALAGAYHLTPAELARWAHQPATRQTLGGLCVLADLQTQLLLSRYRMVAVTRLIEQATGQTPEGGGVVTVEQSRKACETLLRADLKRAGEPGPGAEEGAAQDPVLAQLRAAMGGEARDSPTGGDPG